MMMKIILLLIMAGDMKMIISVGRGANIVVVNPTGTSIAQGMAVP